MTPCLSTLNRFRTQLPVEMACVNPFVMVVEPSRNLPKLPRAAGKLPRMVARTVNGGWHGEARRCSTAERSKPQGDEDE